ncbi:MAG: prepilin-type N-terminal cleavage/methylation domain-containing protein [Azoarcus sp.]|jgi:general secretion pathway protein J|nr:prepilin-type N-terminal cleavage/methylation domain-containing protein [Azoarcus sp.]
MTSALNSFSGRQAFPTGSGGARGFTLIEIIIALALMSLIMLGLVSAFATLGKTATRINEHAGRSGREWLAGEFLHATLSSAVGQIKQTLPDQSKAVYFRGGPATVQWLGSMPARYGVGGLHVFRLGLEPCGSGMCLALHYAPYVKEDAFGNAAADFQTQILADKVSGFRIAYQSHPARNDEEAVWSEDWTDADNLPARTRIDLASQGAARPPVIVSIGAIDAADGEHGTVSSSPPFQAEAPPP